MGRSKSTFSITLINRASGARLLRSSNEFTITTTTSPTASSLSSEPVPCGDTVAGDTGRITVATKNISALITHTTRGAPGSAWGECRKSGVLGP